jgi:hypothetical protein
MSNNLLPAPIDAEHVTEESETQQLRDELDELREEFNSFRASVDGNLRQVAGILQGFRAALGGQPASAAPDGGNQSIPSAVYDAWKQRLPPACGKIIDALLVQPMTNMQLKKFCKLGTSTVPQMITILTNNKLVEKQGAVNHLRRP